MGKDEFQTIKVKVPGVEEKERCGRILRPSFQQSEKPVKSLGKHFNCRLRKKCMQAESRYESARWWDCVIKEPGQGGKHTTMEEHVIGLSVTPYRFQQTFTLWARLRHLPAPMCWYKQHFLNSCLLRPLPPLGGVVIPVCIFFWLL